MWEVIRLFLSENTKNLISLYGKDKSQWQPALQEYIDKTQLTKEFGGLKDNPVTLDELRDDYDGYFQCEKFAFKNETIA